MLKGFVSGEEKDIKRIPMNGKNLFDKNSNIVAYYLTQTPPIGVYTATASISRSILIPCEPSTTYTIMIPANRTLRIVSFSHYPQPGDSGDKYESQETGTYIKKEYTYTTSSNAIYMCVFCYNSAQEATTYDEAEYFSQIMLNLGSQPLPYEPYGYQEGWEVRDNQDRLIWGREDELQTATGTLPFKGYSLPVKVKSLLGNAVQNGMPAPDNIVTPV